jgi:hypothetical protein
LKHFQLLHNRLGQVPLFCFLFIFMCAIICCATAQLFIQILHINLAKSGIIFFSSCKIIASNSLIFEQGTVIYFPRTETAILECSHLEIETSGGVAQKVMAKRRTFLRRRAKSTCDPILEEEVGIYLKLVLRNFYFSVL